MLTRRRQREPGMHAPAAGRIGPGVDGPAVLRGALAHPAQPVPVAVVGGQAAAVVADVELQRPVLHRDRHDRAGGPRVLDDVAQRLLHDPVRRGLHDDRHAGRVARALQPHAQVVLLQARHELVEVLEPRLRRAARRAAPERG